MRKKKLIKCTLGCLFLTLFFISLTFLPHTISRNASTDHALNKYAVHEEYVDETLPPKQQKKIDHNRALIQTHKVKDVNKVAKLDKTNRDLKNDIDNEEIDKPDKLNPYPLITGSHWDVPDPYGNQLTAHNGKAYLIKSTNITLAVLFIVIALLIFIP